MNNPDSMMFFLRAGTGIFWIITYLLIIKRGFQDKTFGMPMAAICANISWEFVFSFVYPHEGIQLTVNIIWFVLDVIIMFQYLKYGAKQMDGVIPLGYFYGYFMLSVIVAFSLIVTITHELEDFEGKYAAFSQNLMMSILFISMLGYRCNVNGQSMYIAIFKMIGSLLPTIAFYLFYSSPLIYLVCAITFIFDMLYAIMLYNMFRKMGLNPWTRRYESGVYNHKKRHYR